MAAERPEDLQALEIAHLDQVRAGDLEAFAPIVQAHRSAALRFACSLVDRTTAEDIVSDVFERVLEALKAGGGPRGPVRPYLFRAVRNRAVDLYRRRREAPSDMLEAEPAATDPYAALDDALVLRRAFSKLPARWRRVLWMAHVEELDRIAMAAELGIPVGAVAQLSLRAREGLRRAYLREHLDVTTSPECGRVVRLLPGLVGGHTRLGDRRAVEEHVDGCDQCRQALAGLFSLGRNLAAVLIAVGGTAILSLNWRATPAVAADLVRSAPRRRFPRSQVIVVATALAAVAAVASAAAFVGAGAAPRRDGVTSLGAEAASSASERAGQASSTPRASDTPSASLPATISWPAPGTNRPSEQPTAPSSTASSPPSVAPSGPSSPSAPPPAPSLAPTVPVTVTPTPTEPTPTGSADPTPTAVQTHLELQPMQWSFRGDSRLPLHLTVPVLTDAGSDLVMSFRIDRLNAYQVHSDAAYAPWVCVAAASPPGAAVVECHLHATTQDASLGIDLSYDQSPGVVVEVSASSATTGPAQATMATVLPALR